MWGNTDEGIPALDYPTETVAEPAHRKRPWTLIAAAVIAASAMAGAAILAGPGMLNGKLISGTPTANAGGVQAAAEERKAAEEARQAQEKAAADQAYLRLLEGQTKQSMQDYFNGPDNDLGTTITITDVSLIKTAENKYEGIATMAAGSHEPHQIPIHVTADERNLMWETDQGALLPLFH
jgi:hypothetical protein